MPLLIRILTSPLARKIALAVVVVVLEHATERRAGRR
jgi:hypothetical protein